MFHKRKSQEFSFLGKPYLHIKSSKAKFAFANVQVYVSYIHNFAQELQILRF